MLYSSKFLQHMNWRHCKVDLNPVQNLTRKSAQFSLISGNYRAQKVTKRDVPLDVNTTMQATSDAIRWVSPQET